MKEVYKSDNSLLVKVPCRYSMNEVYRSDNLSVLQSMEPESIDMIYIDPPFNTGKTQKKKIVHFDATSDESVRKGFGGKNYKIRADDTKEMSYSDYSSEYIEGFLKPRIIEAHRILKNTGTFYLHLDYREVHYAKVMCDQIFGRDNFLNEIIWAYDYGAKSKSKWPAKHDNILVYVKDIANYFFDSTQIDRIPYMAPGLVGPDKAKIGKLPTTVWWMTIVPTNGKEKTGYPTQKPLKLLERIINASCPKEGIVLDAFAGAGTSGIAAASQGKQFILIDNNPDAIETIKNRINSVCPNIDVAYYYNIEEEMFKDAQPQDNVLEADTKAWADFSAMVIKDTITPN